MRNFLILSSGSGLLFGPPCTWKRLNFPASDCT